MIVDSPEKGLYRHDIYKAVIDRFHQAMVSGYYLEAIVLMESLITDRLASRLLYRNIETDKVSGLTVGRASLLLIRNDPDYPKELLDSILEWGRKRNLYAHEMAKLFDGDEHSFDDRYAEANEIAKQGYELFCKTKKIR